MNPDTPQSGKRAGGKSGARAGGATEGSSSIDPTPSVGSPSTAEPGATAFDTSQPIGTGEPFGSASGTTGTMGGGDRRQAGRLIDQVKDKATSQLNSQKQRATAGLGSVADAVRQTGRQLRDQRQDAVAEIVENAASQIERFTNHLKDRNLDELVDDAQRLARQQPALFIGGSFAAGLIAARFIKASSPARRASYGGGDPGWRDTAGYSGESVYGSGDMRTRSTGFGSASPSGLDADRPPAGEIRDRGGL
jgi:hypothetical protein